MRAHRAVSLLLIVAALGWMANCSQTQTAAREESAPPSVQPRISQKVLNSLLRQNRQEAQPAAKAKMWAHKVRHRRETLFSIALWYTGSGENWPRLAAANPNIDAKRIHIGDTILIPEDLLKTRRLMPANFPKHKRKRRKIRKPQPPGVHPPAQNEETPLFGPIENDLQPVEPEKNELPVPLETLDR
jgi:hypothetical protein